MSRTDNPSRSSRLLALTTSAFQASRPALPGNRSNR
jgi:hypothetical protein